MDKDTLFFSLKDLRYKYICLEVSNSNFEVSWENFTDQVVILEEMNCMLTALRSKQVEFSEKERESFINLELFLNEKNSDISTIKNLVEAQLNKGD